MRKIRKILSRKLNVLFQRQKLFSVKKKLKLNKILLEKYLDDLNKTKILLHILECQGYFNQNVINKTYRKSNFDFGGMGRPESELLYAIIRHLKPLVVLETGVCNGVSSAIILQALHDNEKGELYSIDFPEIEGITYEDGLFWKGKGGAIVPRDKQPGWIVPDYLRNRWHLKLGKSQDVLPILLDRLESVDIFIHDSEHSYECMYFEYENVYSRLNSKGILISDDINWNDAFNDFSDSKGLEKYYLSEKVGVLFKK